MREGFDSRFRGSYGRYAEIIRSSGESLLTIINDILDFSKIEAGKLELEVIDFDLRSAVETTMEMLAVKALEKEIERHRGQNSGGIRRADHPLGRGDRTHSS